MKRTPLLLALVVLAALLVVFFGEGLGGEPGAVDAGAVVRPGDQGRVEDALTGGADLEEARRALVDVPPTTLEAGASPEAGAFAESTGGLHLRVVDEVEQPVPDVEVILSPAGGPRLGHGNRILRTDAAGEARVADLPPGRTTVTCTLGARKSVEIEAGAEAELVLVLKDTVAVTGRVEDADGRGVPGAQVWVADWGKSWRRTRPLVIADAEGRFRAPHVGKERSLGATAADHGPSALVDLEHRDTSEPPVELVLTLTAEGGAIEGTVVDHEGRPVPGALVAIGVAPDDYGMRHDGTMEEYWCSRTQPTDERGFFREVGVPTGSVPVHVHAPSAPELRQEVEVQAGRTTSVTLELGLGMRVRGVVTDAQENPVEGALVIALDEPFVDPFPTQGPTEVGEPFHRPATRTAADGTYELDRLPPGEVHLYSARGTSFWDHRSVEFLGTAQETLAGAAGDELTWSPVLERGRRLVGRVVYADGSEMGNVFVSATDSDGRRYTQGSDEHGAFSIPGLEDRPYKVSVQLWDPPEDALPLEQEGVRPSEVELVLTASYSVTREDEGEVRVRVDDRAERVPGKGAVIFAHSRGWRHAREDDGVFEATMPPGRYQARVMQGEVVVGASDWFDLGPGEDLDLGTIETRASGSLLVRVNRPPGMADRKVFARVETDTSHRMGRRPFDADELLFEDLLTGVVTVEVDGPGLVLMTRRVQIQGDTTVEVDLDLMAGTPVTVRVTADEVGAFGVLKVLVLRGDGEVYTDQEFHQRWGAELPLDVNLVAPLGTLLFRASTTDGQAGEVQLEIEDLEPVTGEVHLK